MVNLRKSKTILKFKSPASFFGGLWKEGLVSGSGLVGATVLGGAVSECIMLTHSDSIWQGKNAVLPDVVEKIKQTRKNIEAGNFASSESIISDALIAKGYRPQVSIPLPICDVKIKTNIEKTVKEYMRVLNMENGEVSVVFKDGTTKFDRSLFASRASNIVCMEISRVGQKTIDATFSLDVHDKTCIKTTNGFSKLPEAVTTKYENNFMFFAAKNDAGGEFGAVCKVEKYGGTSSVLKNGIAIKGAERVLILMAVFVDGNKEKQWSSLKTMLGTNKLTYDKMLKDHTTIYSKLFGSMDLDLASTKKDAFIEDLIDQANDGNLDPTLIEKLWAYGRYLFIASSNEKSQPINPYGIWCGDYKAENSFRTANSTLPRLYSNAINNNLEALMLPIFNFYENNIDDLKKNAIRLFGCRGVYVPTVNNAGSGLVASLENSHLNSVCNSAIVGLMFYNYYLATVDIKFLKTRALPFMANCILFYEDFLRENKKKQLTSIPSYSPYNNGISANEAGKKEVAICENATIDFASIKELVKALISANKLLGINKEIANLEAFLAKLGDYEIAEDGTVKEYLNSNLTENPESAFAPQLAMAGLGCDASLIKNVDLMKAFSITAKRKLNSQMSSMPSYADLALTLATTGDFEECYNAILNIVRGGMLKNLNCVSNDWRGMGFGLEGGLAPIRLDCNIAISAAIVESFVTSKENYIKINNVPESFKKYTLENVLTKCSTEVDLDYNKNTLTLKLKAKKAGNIIVEVPAKFKKFKGLKTIEFNPETKLCKVSLVANKLVTLIFN